MLLVGEEGGTYVVSGRRGWNICCWWKKRVEHMLLVGEEGGTYVVSGRRGWNICC